MGTHETGWDVDQAGLDHCVCWHAQAWCVRTGFVVDWVVLGLSTCGLAWEMGLWPELTKATAFTIMCVC